MKFAHCLLSSDDKKTSSVNWGKFISFGVKVEVKVNVDLYSALSWTHL